MNTAIDPTDMRAVAQLIWGQLDYVAKKKGEPEANQTALANIHGNVAYLRETLGDVNVIEMLGELRESILTATLNKLRTA